MGVSLTRRVEFTAIVVGGRGAAAGLRLSSSDVDTGCTRRGPQPAIERCELCAEAHRQTEIHGVVDLHMLANREANEACHRIGIVEVADSEQIDDLCGFGDLCFAPTVAPPELQQPVAAFSGQQPWRQQLFGSIQARLGNRSAVVPVVSVSGSTQAIATLASTTITVRLQAIHDAWFAALEGAQRVLRVKGCQPTCGFGRRPGNAAAPFAELQLAAKRASFHLAPGSRCPLSERASFMPGV